MAPYNTGSGCNVTRTAMRHVVGIPGLQVLDVLGSKPPGRLAGFSSATTLASGYPDDIGSSHRGLSSHKLMPMSGVHPGVQATPIAWSCFEGAFRGALTPIVSRQPLRPANGPLSS
jgi:hypothetical protein